MIFIHIGIDIGGSHTGMGFINDDGEIIARKDLYYNKENFELNAMFQTVNDFIEKYEEKSESVGIGIPGFATDTHIHYTCNLPINDMELTDYLNTKLPIYISNDANCATIAEYELIDRKMYSNYIFMTIGTGIGSGMIVNGNLYTGSTGVSGEVGHMVIDKDGLECSCGRKGCFEKYASVSALLKNTGAENLKEAFYLIEKNGNMQHVFENYLENLSEGIANIINIFDPEMVVIGGGLSEYGDKIIHPLKTQLISKIYNQCTYDINIKVASLKNDAGIIGASMLHRYLI